MFKLLYVNLFPIELTKFLPMTNIIATEEHVSKNSFTQFFALQPKKTTKKTTEV